ncbi:MAG: preprotein translocase subunit SecA [Alphaproteobacteria bacterium]|nr:preprotein translocase subunit SecA [Alphaproteobacteria bacterium]
MSFSKVLGLQKIFGTRNDRYIKGLLPTVQRINALESEMKALDDDALKAKTSVFKERLKAGETVDNLLPEAFAVVREAAWRSLGLRAFDVQLMGGIILHRGNISEMKTGEGKTLVATFPAYLNALTGESVHVVTVNDYLAKRDSEWMAQVFNFLGLSVSALTNDLPQDKRKEAYASDIVYATNNELGFDYLRDNMTFTSEQQVQRDLGFAIVDEVDSILVDEARTPLIISGPTDDKTGLYMVMNSLVPALKVGDHYEVDEKSRAVALTDSGIDAAEGILKEQGLMEKDDNLYDMQHVMLVHHLTQALKAHATLRRDVDYIIHQDGVVLIDEFTGRMTPGRRLSEGLHQALEAKEGVQVQSENQVMASITFQNYFRLYGKLSGMTGTAETEAEEFESIYGMGVIVVPTNITVSRVDDTDIIYRTADAKIKAAISDIKSCAEKGQPVLVGTSSIEKSELLSEHLKKARIQHEVLNARHHEREAEIIAQAGRLGAVTIATNMAGRGTDIKLGGNLDLLLEGVEDEAERKAISDKYDKEKAKVVELGGLRVIGTERNESRRIDNQLRGRAGRQGDAGSSVFYISLQDDLMRIFAKNLDGMMARLDMPEDEAIQSRLVGAAIETAQRKIEGRNFEIRKSLLKFDNILNDQRKTVYEHRNDILSDDDLSDVIEAYREEAHQLSHSNAFVGNYAEKWNVDSYKDALLRYFDVKLDIDKWVEAGKSPEDIYAEAQKHIAEVWNQKNERLGADVMRKMEKGILLQALDMQWKDHLQRLDYLKQGIHLRGYGQKDPLNEFKKEAFGMFSDLLDRVRDETVMITARVDVRKEDKAEFLAQDPASEAENANDTHVDFSNMDISRNAPCPCGSGKKFKHCHGAVESSEVA